MVNQEIKKISKVFLTHDQFNEIIRKIISFNKSPISGIKYEIKRTPPYSEYILGTEQKGIFFSHSIKLTHNRYTKCRVKYWPKKRITNKQSLKTLLNCLFESFWKSSLRTRLAGIPDLKRDDEALYIVQNTIEDESNWPCYLLFCDIDNFHEINNECGHFIGDDILKKVGSILERESKDRAILLHNGGDEFVLLLLKEENNNSVYRFAHRIRQAISDDDYSEYFNKCKGKNKKMDNKTITLSIGICKSPYRNILFDDLLRKADDALLQYAKKNNSGIELLCTEEN
jgi:diguanylate cyclase (GGDEF)-like protein